MTPRERLFQLATRDGLPIPARPKSEPAPLSWAQERFLILEALDPGTTAWHLPVRARLRGPLDVDALRQTLHDLHRRHDTLRSRVVVREGASYQEVTASELELRVVDLRALDDDVRMERVDGLEHAQARPFDLGSGCLWRATLAHVADEEFVLLLRFHHFAIDGWSLRIFLRELGELYAARTTGRSPALPPVQTSYAEFAAWQRGPAALEEQARQLAYWTEQLRDAHPVPLPLDRPRAAQRSGRVGQLPFEIPRPVEDAFRALCDGEDATLFMGLLTAFKVILARYCGVDDIAIATPVADRRDRATRSIVGPFVNTIVVHSSFARGDSFVDALRRERDLVIEGLERKDVPVERVLEALRRSRGVAPPPLNVMFSAPPRGPKVTMGAIELAPTSPSFVRAELDLDLVVYAGDHMWGYFLYNEDLFDHAMVEQVLRQFERLLVRVLADPDAPLAMTSRLDEADAERLRGWNATTTPIEGPQLLHELIARQVARSPDAVAVEDARSRYTYRELAERSARVAGWLAARGVGRGERVTVALERSADMVVAILGVLRAGAAYVPIDLEYPEHRRTFMRTDAEATLELTDEALREALAATEVAPHVEMDAEELAYVIYTSGSTGQPKGVCVPHRAVVNFLHAMQRAPGLTAEDTLLAVTTLSFDIAGLELFLPLATGATVVIAPREATRDGHALAALLATSGATVMQATPATWRLLLAAGWRPMSQLRILCGGEALPEDLAASLLDGAGALWNLYGPTETAIWSTCARITAGAPISLGRPIDNTSLYVLDEALQPVPIGAAGDLYIGGRGVALGYHARRALTAERFVADPFAGSRGARMYRTGDRVRWRSAGTLAYLGRADTQVKLRGHRIELGEIEVALRAEPGVADAAVLVREDHPGNPLLVAYVAGDAVDPAALRTALASTVPDYMVPRAFVRLPALPLTPNGKLDRKALPAPDASALARAVYVAPRDDLERALAQMWAELLGVERVGAHDDFFALGGNSLFAIRLLAQVERELGARVPLRDLFARSSLRDLVDEIRRFEGTGAARPVLEPSGRRRGPLLTQQRGFYRLHRDAPHHPGTLKYSFWLHGHLDVAPFERAVHELVRRHTVLRTRFFDEGGEAWQEVLETLELPTVHHVDISSFAEADREREDAAALGRVITPPFALGRGEVVRVLLTRWSPERHRLTVCLHHAVADFQSLFIFDRQLYELWRAFAADPELDAPAVPSPGLQCIDVVDYLDRLAASSAGARMRAFWDAQLAGATPIVLPTDFPRAPVDALRRAHDGFVSLAGAPGASIVLEADTVTALEELARDAGASVMSVLLALLSEQIAALTGQDDLAYVSHLLYRHLPGLEQTIGDFSNPLIMRVSTAGAPTLDELVQRTHATVTSAYEHGEHDVLRVASHLFRIFFLFRHMKKGVLPPLEEPTPPPGITRAFAPIHETQEGRSPYDFALSIDGDDTRMLIGSFYLTDLFREATIKAFMDRYREAILAACATRRPSRRP